MLYGSHAEWRPELCSIYANCIRGIVMDKESLACIVSMVLIIALTTIMFYGATA